MHSKINEFRVHQILVLLIGAILFSLAIQTVFAVPGGPTMLYNSTDNGPVLPAMQRNDSKGTITTLRMNISQQNLRWKAYVGNVSGKYSLRDSLNYSIYDWNFSASSGELYASRNGTTINWSGVVCASQAKIAAEQTALNHAVANSDSINHTFNLTTHKGFSVGTVPVTADSCNATATNVNNAGNAVTYQEVLLHDGGGAFLYTSLLNYTQTGYNGQTYDFQMLVPEDETASNPTMYYFYLELI